uniref:Uncharacterized protein n=1 Tax=Cacopsylla melanoneura TaxID=428564 RepID=A0A8D8QZ00_9HEMI
MLGYNVSYKCGCVLSRVGNRRPTCCPPFPTSVWNLSPLALESPVKFIHDERWQFLTTSLFLFQHDSLCFVVILSSIVISLKRDTFQCFCFCFLYFFSFLFILVLHNYYSFFIFILCLLLLLFPSLFYLNMS